jgi:cation transport protein ChaC
MDQIGHAGMTPDDELWVFGYGSLMWRPGFDYVERHLARLEGYSRRFCLASRRYRGTPENPGLVLGLDAGGACLGVAYRVAGDRVTDTRAYLTEREMVSYAYHEGFQPVALQSAGQTVDALCYIVQSDHEQYMGGLDLEDQAARIAVCAGPAGTNAEYLFNTMAHLRELQVDEPDLQRIEDMVRLKMAEV